MGTGWESRLSRRDECTTSAPRREILPSQGSLEGRVAMITGGGSGIGRACAIAMAHAGATVAICDNRADWAEETLSAVEEEGGSGAVFVADVTRSPEVADIFERVVAAYGRLDCACNNAGVVRSLMQRVHEYPDNDWNRVLSINARGTWLCLRHEGPADVASTGWRHRQHGVGGGSPGEHRTPRPMSRASTQSSA